MTKLEYIIVIAIKYKKSAKLVILDTLMDMAIVLTMESEYLDIIPQRPVSMADMLKGREIKKQNIRKEFTEEAYKKMLKKWDKRTIALMINKVCPKEGGDAWVHDYWKSCKESDSFGKCFWGIYNKAKSGKIILK